MVKENEIRLGNWFKDYSDKPFQFSKEEFLTLCLETAEVDEIIKEPIALTEEWLLKFGFEKHINETQIDGIEMKLQISGYGRDGSWFSSCGKLNGGLSVLCLCRGNYFSNNLEFVHELQNLYFCLTGQELSVVANGS